MAKEDKKKHRHAVLTAKEISRALNILERRLDEFENMSLPNADETLGAAITTLVTKVNTTYDSIFGADTAQASNGQVEKNNFYGFYATTFSDRMEAFNRGRQNVLANLRANIDLLKEQAVDDGTADNRILQAYLNLDLHSEIARAASNLYQDGHYANAIEDAVKALNDLVRLRSGIQEDGAKLMNKVFSPDAPVLKFNSLVDASDKDEQRGFMMLFAGAVAGLRNPRAHKLIQDDSERALEFIALVSLLAKLLDGAKK